MRFDQATSAAWNRLQAALSGRPMPPLVLVLGLGQGEVLAALDDQGADTKILAVEPDAFAVRRLLAQPAVLRWVESGRLTCLTGPDYAGAASASRLFPPDPEQHVVVVDPSLAARGEVAVQAAQTLKKIVFGARANAEARRQFAPRYLTNSLRNAPAIAAGRDVRALQDLYRGSPAIIAAAGPSLDDAIEPLRARANHALLIAVDTALRPLLSAGIEPHLAVGLDPSELNARHFQGLPRHEHTWLMCESALDPAVPKQFDSRTAWFRVSDHEPWPWYRELGLDVGVVDVWGSVITAAFQAALLAGCDPVVFVGADLAFSGGRPYARGTTYELSWTREVMAGRSLAEIWHAWTHVEESTEVAGLDGAPVRTTPALLAFRDWLVSQAAVSGRRIVNASGSGILCGSGIEQGSVHGAVSSSIAVPSVTAVLAATKRLGRRSELAKAFEQRRRARGHGAADALAARWDAFCGRADWLAIDDALSAAAQQLSTPSRSTETSEGACYECLRGVPELAERLKVLIGLGGGAAEPLAADPMRLFDALAALAVLQQHAASGVDLEPCPQLVGPGVPARMFAWHESVAAAAKAFDRALNDGLRCVAHRETFFSRATIARERDALGLNGGNVPVGSRVAAVCARFGLQWATAVAMQAESTDGSRGQRARQALLVHGVQDERPATPAAIVLDGQWAGATRSVELPLDLAEEAMARAFTGSVHVGGAPSAAPRVREFALASLTVSGLRLSATLRYGTGSNGPERPITVEPRVLSDEGVPAAQIAYTDAQGVVCVSPFTNESFLVHGDGTVVPWRRWPRPILGELPIGNLGIVAWSNGLGTGTASGSAYLMHRTSDGDTELIEELPFRPGRAVWWRGRLMFTSSLWGVGAWAPNAGAALVLRDRSFIHLEASGDGLLLTPCVRDADGARVRQRTDRAWHWDGEREPVAVDAGPFGAPAGRARSGDGWQATAHPEADLLLLRDPAGRELTMTCYQPYQVAWLGTSLLVTTCHGEVLLFPALARRLSEEPS